MKLFKKLTGLLVGATMALGIGIGLMPEKVVPVHAAEEVYYTLTPTSTGGNSTPHNSYTAAATTTIDGIGWSVTGNSNMVPWRIGGKNISGVDRDVHSQTAMGSAITKVELTLGAASSCTVNSVTLSVGTTENNNDIDIVIKNEGSLYSTTLTFIPTSGDKWAISSYYTFTFNVSVSGTSNKFVTLTEAKFYANDGSGHEHIPGTAVTENNVAPTCTESGGYDTVIYCTECEEELSRVHTDISALGHDYVDGVCTRCGALESEYHLEYTTGTTATACTVNGHDGIKVGTGKADGNMSITIPSGITKIKVYIAAWNGGAGTVTLSGVLSDTLTLTANSGIANNSPFTLNGNETSFRFDLTVTSGTLTIASGTARRFVVWGATDLFAETFANEFMTKLTCNGAGTSEPTYATGYSWEQFKTDYNKLDAEEKERFTTPDSATADAVARYDYIVGKYGTENYEDFMHRNPAQIGHANLVALGFNQTTAVNSVAIIIVATVTILSLGVFFLLRKKKEN